MKQNYELYLRDITGAFALVAYEFLIYGLNYKLQSHPSSIAIAD